jgi:hypothetical protein
MFPEDRVLVGVINRKRDLVIAQQEGWYRIPQARMRRGVNAEYIAFFLSRTFKEKNGGIYYYAERNGLELAHRKDLLPKEADHPRANEVYYKVQVGELVEKQPPVLNPSRRAISFIYTTWDRFVRAQQISDLYSQDDYFVDRIYHALRNKAIYADRIWHAEYPGSAPQLRILCETGTVRASTAEGEGTLYLDKNQGEDKLLAKILAEIASHDGPVLIGIPGEGYS